MKTIFIGNRISRACDTLKAGFESLFTEELLRSDESPTKESSWNRNNSGKQSLRVD